MAYLVMGTVSGPSRIQRGGIPRIRPQHPGPGSYRVLELLARLGVAGVEPLAYTLRISLRTTYDHLSRLERAGLVSRLPYRDGGGGIVAITRQGADWVRDDDLPTVVPKSHVPTTGVHSRAVSWVVADFELRGRGYWLGPAELRQDEGWRVQRDDGAGHLPDLGIVTSAGKRIAIEVELHSKSNIRLRFILHGYSAKISTGDLSYVGYVCNRPAVARAVRRQADAVYLFDKSVRFARLDHIIAVTRERAAASKTPAATP